MNHHPMPPPTFGPENTPIMQPPRHYVTRDCLGCLFGGRVGGSGRFVQKHKEWVFWPTDATSVKILGVIHSLRIIHSFQLFFLPSAVLGQSKDSPEADRNVSWELSQSSGSSDACLPCRSYALSLSVEAQNDRSRIGTALTNFHLG